ncbi:MAG: hypothetical protein K2P45_08620 [Eubacterium sp.]|nr:hypothetical protein [Eubacterium sp.]
MSDKQYDGMLLDFIEDFEDIEEIALSLPDSQQKQKLLEMIDKKKKKTERKLETPAKP